MPFQNCPGIAQLEFFFSWQGQRCENVFHVRKATPWSTAELTALAAEGKLWIENDWNDVAEAGCSAVGVKAIDLSTELGGIAEPAFGEPVVGNLAASNTPTNATVAIGLRTAFRGRSFRGRAYHVGLSMAYVVNSILTVAGQAALATSYTALKTRMATTAGTLCVLSRRHDKALRAVGLGFDVVTIHVNEAVDSQRRRLPERGA